jgi:adenylate cyclase
MAQEDSPEQHPTATERQRGAKLASGVRGLNRNAAAVRAIRATREFLPGDSKFGDELSTAGDRPAQILARHLGELNDSGDKVTHEVGLAGLQLWQAFSEAIGRGGGNATIAILFTDLVGFSSWVLEVGDELALQLLRAVAGAVEPEITRRKGRIVKRLGDGHMAVFPDAQAAVDAALAMQERLQEVEVGGHRPRLRVGLHVGRPRKVGGDYLGTDVNIASRVAEAAGAGEVLVSDAALADIEADGLSVRRRRKFRAKGAPREMDVFCVARGQ